MAAPKFHVHVVADSSAKLAGVRAALECHYGVTAELLGGPGVQHSECYAFVVKVDLRLAENIASLKKTLGSPNQSASSFWTKRSTFVLRKPMLLAQHSF